MPLQSNDKRVGEFITCYAYIKLNLRAINTEAYCVGQTNTYTSSCRNSMIDYILFEEDLMPSVRHVEIAAETPDNTAIHLPVILHIELNKINETLIVALL